MSKLIVFEQPGVSLQRLSCERRWRLVVGRKEVATYGFVDLHREELRELAKALQRFDETEP